MPCTRRLLEPALLALVALGGAAASCASEASSHSDDRGDAGSPPNDVGGDASATREPGAAEDASAPPIDASALPIVCAKQPCATALVTTHGILYGSGSQSDEGFCALLSDGTVACWGADSAGQLGRGTDAGADGPRADSPRAERVVGLSGVVSLDRTCAIDTSGAIWCWAVTAGSYLRDAGTPSRVPAKLPLPPAKRIGVGDQVMCAVLVGEEVRCWGVNTNAQIGPVGMPFSPSPQSITIPDGPPIRQLAVGFATLAVREDGTLVTWGANPGIGRVSSLFPDGHPTKGPLEGVSTVDSRFGDACAVAGGVGYCWGVVEEYSQDTDRALPEPVVTPEPIVDMAMTVVKDAAPHSYRWCAVGASGSVYCWGFNESGQAGGGNQEYAFEAVKVVGLPGRAARVRTTPNTTCALLTDGTVHCWGSNFYGQLGSDVSKAGSLVPIEVTLP